MWMWGRVVVAVISTASAVAVGLSTSGGWLLAIALGVVGLFLGFFVGWVIAAEGAAALTLVEPPETDAPAPTERPGPAPGWLMLLVLSVLLLAFTAYGRVDILLHSLHQTGQPSFGTDTLTAPSGNPFAVTAATVTWFRYDHFTETNLKILHPDRTLLPVPDLLGLQFSVDSLLIVPAYALLLAMLIGATRRLLQREWKEIGETASPSLVQGYLATSKWALVALIAAACGDWTENGSLVTLLRSTWSTLDPHAWVWCLGRCASVGTFVLAIGSWLKVLGLLAVAVFLGSASLLSLHHGGDGPRTWVRFPRVRTTIFRLLLPGGSVAVFAALLMSNDQAPDMLRRWTEGGSEISVIATGGLATLVLALMVAISAWWLLLRPRAVPQTAPAVEETQTAPPAVEEKGRKTNWGLLLSRQLTPLGWWFHSGGLVWYAVVWAVAWQAANGWLPWWIVLAVVAGLGVVVLVPVRALFENREPRDQKKPDTDPRYWLLALPFISVGLLVLVADAILSQDPYPFVPFGVILAVLIVGAPLWRWPPATPVPYAPVGVGPFLCALIAVIVGMGVLSAGLDVYLYHWWLSDNETEASPLIVLAIAFGIGGSLASWWLARRVVLPFFERRFTAEADLAEGETEKLRARLPPASALRRDNPAGFSGALLIGGVAVWLTVLADLAAANNLYLRGASFGLLTALCVTLALVLAVGTGLEALVEEAFPLPPPLLRIFGASRTSVVPIVLVWLTFNASPAMPDPTHDARLLPEPGQHVWRDSATTMDDAFKQWLDRHCLTTPAAGSAARPVVPLILVASQGGGIRAAAWTAYVLDYAFNYGEFVRCQALDNDKRRSDWVFAMSGISGGSVGLATYAARQASADDARARGETAPPWTEQQDREGLTGQPARTPPDQRGWIRTGLGTDGLTPTLGWMLLAESQWQLLRFPLSTDRATVLEHVFESWAAEPMPTAGSAAPRTSGATLGLFDVQSRNSLPWLMLNGTSVESGCRFNGSVLRTASDNTGTFPPELPLNCLTPIDYRATPGQTSLGATVDLVDYVCQDQDIRLSTAALLSARFPYVSPSGGLHECPTTQQSPAEQTPRTFVVDGGYHEGTGMATAVDVWNVLAPLVDNYNEQPNPAIIVPMLVQITNGYSEPVAPGLTPVQPQVLVPPSTYLATRGAVEARARQQGQIVFTEQFGLPDGKWFCGPRYAHFALRPHPGPSAPLGWVLSDVSFDDFVQQLKIQSATGSLDSGRPGDMVNGWFSSTALDSHVLARCP